MKKRVNSRILSNYAKVFLLVCLFLLSTQSINATSEIDGGVTPDVICDPELGCYLYSTTEQTVSYSVKRYSQEGYTDYLKNEDGTDARSTEYPDDITRYRIKEYGCAITAQAMVANYLYGYGQNSIITPPIANVTVPFSHFYSSARFMAGYSGVACVGTCGAVTLTDKLSIAAAVGQKIVNNQVVIMGGYMSSNHDKSHFVVVNGYKYKTEVYEYGQIKVYTELVLTDPSGVNRTTLAQFLSKYNVVSRIHPYRAN